VIYNATNPVTLFLTNSTLNLASITISGLVLVELQSGSLLEVMNLTLDDGASLVVTDVSVVQLNGTANLGNSTLALHEFATYTQKGLFMQTNMSELIATDNATISLDTAEILGGLSLDQYTHFSASKIYFNKSQTINAESSFSQAYFKSVSVSFGEDLSVTTIVSSSSTVTVGGNLNANTLVLDGSLEVFGNLVAPSVTATATIIAHSNYVTTTSYTTSPLTVYGSLQATNFSIGGAYATIMQGLYSDYVRVAGDATLTVSTAFFVSLSLNITNASSLVLQSVSASINSTKLGHGEIFVNASTLALNTSYSTPNAHLTFDGYCVVTAPTVYIYDFDYSDTADVILELSSGIQLNQTVYFPGSIHVTGSLNAVGSVIVTGDVAMSVGTANVQGTFSPLGGLFFNNTVFTIGSKSSINTTTMVVGPNSTLNSLFTTSIYASLINNGLIITNANMPLDITGKFTQMKTATFQINNLNRGLPAMVTVVGTASISGALSYTPLVIAAGETVKLPVLVTTNGITGKFISPTLPFNSYSYEPNNMYVIISESGAGEGLHLSWALFVLVLATPLLNLL
jgi:hypothetical protein